MSKKVVGIAQLKSALSSAGDKLVVVDVGASWCGPCKQIAPLVEDLAHQHQQKAVFLAVDGDASRDVVSHFGVQGFPTFVFLRNGVEVDRLVGADSSKLTSMVTRLCVKPEPRSTFSFPPAQFVLLQTGQISGIATFISGKVNNLGPAESAKLAALSSAADDGVAIALFSKEPGVFSKLLCDLLSALPDEFAFSVFNLASKLLTNEAGASALALMAGTNLFFLDRVEKAAFGKLETSDAPKHAANKNGLALEAISNALCHEKTRDLFLLKALDFVLASADSYSKLGERSQVAIATIILNASIIAWKQRGPESLSSKCCHILLLLLQQKIASSAALIRLLGAVGTNVFLVHCVNSREDGVTWNVEPAILLQSLDISFKSDEKVSHVVGELKAAFELPL